ncbi:hypothetical protein D5F01_LYC16346 [Larimichthys crocea]|uniref:Uncharacterized protein n=1 Tax=Larimichthys crocea TaxID=215358 RepID=A0A6G0I0W3_LARCR|nr:hypothetical protein D5F01_LYC16346 [Larimichthys crocea]
MMMDSSTISGSINDQPTSTHNHDGLLVEECCQSVFAAPDSSTSDHESPHLKAGISESESSEKLLSFHYGSDKKHSYSSDADDEDEDDLFSNSGSGEEYQPSSTPSSSDSEEFSEKEKKSSRHTIPEKDHCHQSSGEHEQLEALDLSTKNTSPHPFEKRKGGKKGGKKQQGGDKRQKVTVNTSQKKDKTFQVAKIGKLLFAMEQGAKSLKGKSLKTLDSVVFDERHDRPPTTGSRRGEEGQTSGADRPLEVTDDGDLQHLSTPSSPVERPKKTATRRRHDDNARSESDVDEEESQQQTPERPPVDWSDDERGGKQQPMMNTPPPVKRRKKTSTKQKHDEDSGDEEQSITATKSSAKKRKKTAATATTERGKTGKGAAHDEHSTPIKRRKKTSTKQKHDEDSGDEEQSITATKSSAKKRKKLQLQLQLKEGKQLQELLNINGGGKEQPMMNTPPPIKRRKKTSTKQKHDEDSGEQSITATKSSAKKRKKTAATATAERGKTAPLLLKEHWLVLL